MQIWDYDTSKQDLNSESWQLWKLQRQLDYGLGEEKLSRVMLEKYWDQLKMPDETRTFLELILWQKHF